MRRIFSSASSVIVYLGSGSNDIVPVLNAILDGGFTAILRSQERSGHALRLLREFLRLPYFRRIWVTQEIYAARHLEVVYAGHSFGGELFQNLVRVRKTTVNTENYFQLPLTVTIRGFAEPPTLWTLLCWTRTFEASDPRDKLIALLGIAQDMGEEVKAFLIDYWQTVTALWQRVITYFFFRAIGLDISKTKLLYRPHMCHSILDTSDLFFDASCGKYIHRLTFCEPPAPKASTLSVSPSGADRIAFVSSPLSMDRLGRVWESAHAFLDTALSFDEVMQVRRRNGWRQSSSPTHHLSRQKTSYESNNSHLTSKLSESQYLQMVVGMPSRYMRRCATVRRPLYPISR